jgi:2-polyprenyl-6-methoxyphenol hydroxylase-like FAD-dependent oxidoreductase
LSDAQFLVDPHEDKSNTDFAILLRTGRDDVWRCAYGDDGSLTKEELKKWISGRLERILPLNPNPNEVEILQAQPYKVHQRAAATFVKGRVLLAGDAAHVNNPVGGLGLCTGILDARVAALALEKVIKSKAEERVALGQYNSDRRGAFLQLTNLVSTDNLRRLCEASEEADNLRGHLFTKLNQSDEFQRMVQLSMNKMAKGVPGF